MTDFLPTNSRTGEVQDTPLVDDLADVLVRMTIGWTDIIGHDLAMHPDVVRVMARYAVERQSTTEQEATD